MHIIQLHCNSQGLWILIKALEETQGCLKQCRVLRIRHVRYAAEVKRQNSLKILKKEMTQSHNAASPPQNICHASCVPLHPYITHLWQQCHNSKFVIFWENLLKVLKCYNFLWVQRWHNCSPEEFCKLRYDTIPVKSASANISFYYQSYLFTN